MLTYIISDFSLYYMVFNKVSDIFLEHLQDMHI